MTDFEEPAAKISKLEEAANDQDEEMDEGQEEWLSEGILTDDDYPADDQDRSNVNANKSIDGDTTPSLPDDDPEDNLLPDNPQIQENSFTLDNLQPEDKSNAQDNSIAQENLDAQNNSIAQENLDAQNNSIAQENLDAQDNNISKENFDAQDASQDNLPTEGNTESKEYSHIDDISQAEIGTYAQFDSEVQNNSTQDDTQAQDNSEAQKENLLSQVDSQTENNSNAQIEAQTQANSNAQNDSQAQDSRNEQNKAQPMSVEQTLDENIEQTLDNFENSRQSDIPDELGSFLVRKSDNKKAEDKKDGSDTDASSKHSDDGNDTDELLRMLGEDGQKNKKEEKTKKVEKKRTPDSQSSDDDEFIFEEAKVARLNLAKTAILKKHPTKAVPETASDGEDESDGTSDEGATMKKMFVSQKKSNFAAKSTTKKPVRDSIANITKKTITVHRRPAPIKRPVTSTPFPKLISRPEITIKKVKVKTAKKEKEPPKKVEPQKIKEAPKEVKIKESVKPTIEPEEIIDEEGFLEEEDEFDLDEDFQSEPEAEAAQRIMRPEQMDEEVPTDEESQDDEDADSFYDELPSSESDQDDWFTLDVRSERAGDFIPLLGSKAHQFLTMEKNRVTSRLQSLRQNIAALNDSRRQQAEQLRKATLKLAELDAALKA